MSPSGSEPPEVARDRRPPARAADRVRGRAGDEAPGLSLLAHLDHLRRRLVRMALALVAGFLIVFSFVGPIVAFVLKPLDALLPKGSHLIYTEPAEAFMLDLKVAALVGAVVVSPYLLWQLWGLVSPRLGAPARRMAVAFVFFTTLLFLIGATFAHFVVFPWVWKFFASFQTSYMEFVPRIEPTFSLYAKMVLAFGLVFQMPTVVFFLARAGLVTHHTVSAGAHRDAAGVHRRRDHDAARRGVAGDAGRADPGPYGISIGVAWMFGKRRDETG